PAHRIPLLPIARPGGLPVSPKEDFARAVRKLKPEKISIEEHLAGREAEKRTGPDKAESGEAAFPNKHGKKRAAAAPGQTPHAEREKPRPKGAKTREPHENRDKHSRRPRPGGIGGTPSP
ncbi:MAG: hypothetical protein LBS35_05245, partial [Synergistaceae bacterium]|nr:hypothetical protein [Synergistaceae bacterium]